jgi:ABC-type branched-subunit amino acid transport system ATPase component/ABC-type branched-subunit amino acid transport system permease subunit
VIDRLGWAALAAAVAAVPLLTSNTYYLYVAISIGLLTIVTAGLNVLVGFTGQTSLGHAGLYAFGAYTAALCVTRAGMSEWAAVALAIAVTSIVGAAVAAAALRVSGPYLAMVTIAFGLIVEGVLIEWGSVTGGPGGIFNIPKPALRAHYWTVMLAAALALWLTANLRRSAWGRAFLAVKSSEVAAESLGLSSYYVRIIAFTVSAAFAGAAGALFTFLNGYISPDSFTLQTSIVFMLALLFGGLGRIAGPVAGSLALTILPELLTSLLDYRLILYGTLLLVSIYWLPEGVIGALSRGRRPRSSPHLGEEGRRKLSDPPRPIGTGKVLDPLPHINPLPHRGRGQGEGALLIANGVSLSFGGISALADVSLTVDRRSIHAVIGPNGAGKTSFLNVLSGFYAPAAGEITLDGRSTVGLTPYALARAGIARTFQTAQVFGGLSAWENVAVGVAGPRLGSVLGALSGMPRGRIREAAIHARGQSLLEALGLAAVAAEPAEALAAGLRRRLEIARALATDPLLLMLDEPAAGLSPAEIAALDEQLTGLREHGGPAVILVEHHMDLVMAVSDRITVLDYGRVIAAGTPEAVRRDPSVIEAYLGAAP